MLTVFIVILYKGLRKGIRMFLTLMAVWCDHVIMHTVLFSVRILSSLVYKGVTWLLCEKPKPSDDDDIEIICLEDSDMYGDL